MGHLKCDKWHRGQVSCLHLDQMGWERRGGRERKTKRERERKERDFRERRSTLSLGFPAIGPSVFDEVRIKVSPHGKGYAWVPVLGEFRQTPEGRGFSSTCFTLWLRVI